MSRAGEWFWGVLRQANRDRTDDAYATGYGEAADVCMRILTEKTDALNGQVLTGRSLSAQEQFLLASLEKLKSELDAALRAAWNNANSEHDPEPPR